MRKLALLVFVFLGYLACEGSALAQDRAAAGPSSVTVTDNSVRSLPAIAQAARYQAAEDDLVLDADLSSESPLTPGLLALAAWLPIAGILLALALEGAAEIRPQEARSSLWVE